MACTGFPGDEDPLGKDDAYCPECGGCLTVGKGKADCDCGWGVEADPPERDYDGDGGYCPYDR